MVFLPNVLLEMISDYADENEFIPLINKYRVFLPNVKLEIVSRYAGEKKLIPLINKYKINWK